MPKRWTLRPRPWASTSSAAIRRWCTRGFSAGDERLIRSIPEALACTDYVCSSINVGSTKSGINMDAVKMMGPVIKGSRGAHAGVKYARARQSLSYSATRRRTTPSWRARSTARASRTALSTWASPARARCVRLGPTARDASLDTVAELIKRTAFKITRMGQLVGNLASERLGVPFGIVDLSLAPTPAPGDSVANILEEIGLESCGCCGTTATLAMLNDAVKKGGVMASNHVGGLSGAFIPVSEDDGMIKSRGARQPIH